MGSVQAVNALNPGRPRGPDPEDGVIPPEWFADPGTADPEAVP
jgi:hypothetical protein